MPTSFPSRSTGKRLIPRACISDAISRAGVVSVTVIGLGDIRALIAVLDPDVVLRAHGRDRVVELRGAEKVARGAMMARNYAPFVRPALINGAAGVIAFDRDVPFAILAFTVVGDRAVSIDVFNDRELVPGLVATRS